MFRTVAAILVMTSSVLPFMTTGSIKKHITVHRSNVLYVICNNIKIIVLSLHLLQFRKEVQAYLEFLMTR